MRRRGQIEWRQLLESLVSSSPILRRDPAGAFSGMEDETREAYYLAVAKLARHADFSEVQTAETALELAREAQRMGDTDLRRGLRAQHIGFYLVSDGVAELKRRIGYHAPLADRVTVFCGATMKTAKSSGSCWCRWC